MIAHNEKWNTKKYVSSPNAYKSGVFLFGEPQFFTITGDNITTAFSPTVKEIFLFILLNSLTAHDLGVSSDNLNDLFWPGKTGRNAVNNRSVNLNRLRLLLQQLGGCQLLLEGGYWKIEADPKKLKIDYSEYLRVKNMDSMGPIIQIEELLQITKGGFFLVNHDYLWLKPIKRKIGNEMVDIYTKFALSIGEANHAELLIEISDRIFGIDPANEIAMKIKCRAFARLGKHSLAKIAFEDFNSEFRQIYGKPFNESFIEIIQAPRIL